MSIVTISKKSQLDTNPFLSLGFRPFFFGGIVFAILSIALWIPIFSAQIVLQTKNFSIFQWHAHEMIYGYAMAIVAGFLLTAVANWTGLRTTNGWLLGILFSFWVVARCLMFFGSQFLFLAMLFDLSFNLLLLFELSKPILKSKSYKQIGILSKIFLLGLGNTAFYVSCFSEGANVRLSIYGGLYLIVGLILTIGARVFPSFLQAGLALKGKIKNPKWISISSLLLFLVFFINDLGPNNTTVLSVTSWLLFLINGYRLTLWHSPKIWSKPLLWGLFLSFVFITLGFLLFALSSSGFNISPFLAIHSFAFGGIGMSTLSMIPRVTLGHTGRNIKSPPKYLVFPFILLTLAAVFRIIFPIVFPANYLQWILLAQIGWILAFGSLLLIVGKMYFLPRADGLSD